MSIYGHKILNESKKENLDILSVIEQLPKLYKLTPATPEQITKAEKDLSLKFADDYKEYLLNYGAIIADNIELTGIAKDKNINVVDVTKREWNNDSKVKHTLYVIENIGIEGLIIWQDKSGNIYETTSNTAPRKIYSSLSEYIYKDKIENKR